MFKTKYFRQILLSSLFVLAILFFFSETMITQASIGVYTKAWGRGTGTYHGVRADIKSPTATLWNCSGWSVGLVGVTTFTGPSFMEAGLIRQCGGDPYPYSSWVTQSGTPGAAYDVFSSYAPGTYAHAKVELINSSHGDWDASVGGTLLASIILGRTSFPYIAAGGESNPYTGNPIATRARNNRYGSGSTWFYWCYSYAYTNAPGASVGSCSSYSWTASY